MDIAQDTFREVLRRIDDAMAHEKPEAWVTKIAKNKVREYLRYRSRHLSALMSLEEVPEHLLAEEEKGIQSLESGYSELAKILRDILDDDELYLLRRTLVDKAGYLTTAKELGVSLSTVEKRLVKIRKKLEPYFPEFKKKK